MDDAEVRPESATVVCKDDDVEASAKDDMVMGAEWKWRVVEL